MGITVPEQRGMRGYGYYEELYRLTESGWRIAFIVPGVISIAVGGLYALHQRGEISLERRDTVKSAVAAPTFAGEHKALLLRISAIVFATTAVSSVIFQSTSFALPVRTPCPLCSATSSPPTPFCAPISRRSPA